MQRVVNQQLEQLETEMGIPVHLSSEFKAYLDNKDNRIAQEAVEERKEMDAIKNRLFSSIGEINWDYFESILDAYHNSQPDSMFSKGRLTLATRPENHFEGEKNTLNHIKFVTQSMLDLFEGKFDSDLPFVSEARASLQSQKDLMVLAAMFHDAAKPYRHGDIHGWESADILRDILGIDYNNRLAEWAIRHHMPMPFSHKADFNMSNPEALEVARNMARDARRVGINAETAINAFILINVEDWNRDADFFLTPSGEIYGFLTPNEIYLDETVVSPEHPLHEYTHLWDRVVVNSRSSPSLPPVTVVCLLAHLRMIYASSRRVAG